MVRPDKCNCEQAMDYEALLLRIKLAFEGDKSMNPQFPFVYDYLLKSIEKILNHYSHQGDSDGDST